MTTTTYDVINEGTTSYLSVSFFDKDDLPQVPTSVTWQIHDVRTKTVIQAEDTVPSAASVEIIIPDTVNIIITSGTDKELHRVTIKATYGYSQAITSEYDYYVKNLTYIT